MPSLFRYTEPVPQATATGRVAEVYAQLTRDFGGPKPLFASLSPAPDLLAAVWSLLRESLLVGRADRVGKELVAVGVSLANRCPYCVDANTVLLHSVGAHGLADTIARGGEPDDPRHAALLTWAKATRTPASLPPRPFAPADAVEMIGTALTFHVVNRLVGATLVERFLPGDAQRFGLVRRLGAKVFNRSVSRRSERPGDSLALLPAATAPEPAWAEGAPPGAAFAALRTVSRRGGEALGEDAREAVTATIARFGGEHPPMTGGWLADALGGVPAAERPAAKLATLAAVAPYRITDADVAAWRDAGGGTDADLLLLLAYGAVAATESVAAGIAADAEPTGPGH